MFSFVSPLAKYLAVTLALATTGCMQLEIMGTQSPSGAGSTSGATSTPFLGGRWIDSAGNFLIADRANSVAREVMVSTGLIQTVAGIPNPLLHVSLSYATAVAVDRSNNVYVVDTDNAVIREFNRGTGVVSIIAGMPGQQGFWGDGGAATSAELVYPQGIALDSSNDIYIVEPNIGTIREVSATTGIITTVAGTVNVNGYSGDGGVATAAELFNPEGAALDSSNNLYIADTGNCVIREVSASTGIITTVAGTPGSCGYSGDGGAATSGELNYPNGVALDSSNNLYVADESNGIIRKIDTTTGIITTVAGMPGTAGYSGDGGMATSAKLNQPTNVILDNSNNLYIVDFGNQVIREVKAATGIISTVAGTPGVSGYSGDGGAATAAELQLPTGAALDTSNNIYIADSNNSVIREVNAATGDISTFMANSAVGYSGDGGAATSAKLNSPFGAAIDGSGNLFIADNQNNVIRKINVSGTISTVAGDFALGSGYAGDGGPATNARLQSPSGVALDSSNSLYIADSSNNVIRKVAPSGVISTVAGNFALGSGFSGDGGPATSAQLAGPSGIALDSSNNLYVADTGNCVIREVNAKTGMITTVAGGGQSCGFSGDGSAATSAQLNSPSDVVADDSGNLYVADTGNSIIREVDAQTGIISTVAGSISGGSGYWGDGGAATEARLNEPATVALDAHGNLFVGDTNNNVIRKIDAAAGIITTVAGDNSLGAGFSGDGGAATSAQLWSPF